MPYKSDKQRKFFHTQTARDKGITQSTVDEFDSASKGLKLPKRSKTRGSKAKAVMGAVAKKIQPKPE